MSENGREALLDGWREALEVTRRRETG
jgi:hypothetical protein